MENSNGHPLQLANGREANDEALQEILNLPMPSMVSNHDKLFDEMDVWTAASLNGFKSEVDQPARVNPSELSAANHAGWTPLMFASYLSHIETTRRFLELGVQVEQQNARGQTALMLVSSCGKDKILDLLLQHTTNPNLRDNVHRTALHYAALYGQCQLAKILLQSGLDPNAQDIEKMTPTLIACVSGQLDVLNQMLKNGGDPGLRNCRNENGDALAVVHRHTHIGEQLRKQREAERVELHHMFEKKDLLKYWDDFQRRQLTTFSAFSQLTADSLDKLGITLIGPRKKIEGMIHEVQLKRQLNGRPAATVASRHLRPDSTAAATGRESPIAPPIPARDGTPDYRRLCSEYANKLEVCERKVESEAVRTVALEKVLSDQFQVNSYVIQQLKKFAKHPPTVADVQQVIIHLDKANQRILAVVRK